MSDDIKKSRRRIRRPLTEDERALWSRVAGSVAPLGPRRPADAPDGEPAPSERPAEVPAPAPAPAAASPRRAPPPSPLMPIDRRLKQRIARGTEAIDARIDLHGMTRAQAHEALTRFVRHARADGARTVLVITGKGLPRGADSSGERGVLRHEVPLWLKAPHMRDHVVGLSLAHVGHGGEGALYVRLRRPRQRADRD